MMLRLLVAGVAMLAPALVNAHAQLIEIDPGDGSVLPASPDAIHVTFSEAVQPILFRLLDADQQGVSIDYEKSISGSFRVLLPPLGDGLYLFTYRVASADGHPIAATIAFTVGDARVGATAQAAAETGGGWRSAATVVRSIALVLVLLSIGLFLYRQVVAVDDVAGAGWLHGGALAAALLSTAMFLPAQSGVGIGVYINHELLMPLVGQPAVVAQLLFTGGFMVFLIARRRGSLLLSAVGIGLVVLGKLGSGHTATAGVAPLPSFALALHLLLAGFWFGSLPLLYRAARGDVREFRARLSRFSSLGLPAVIVLIVSGATMAWLIVDDWQNPVADRYGQLLTVKVLLVVVVCALALVNRFRLAPILATGPAGAVARLRRNVRIEFGVLLAIIALTGVLAGTTPGSGEGTGTRAQVVMSAQGYTLRIDYEARPGGRVEFRVFDGGAVVAALDARLKWQDRDGRFEAINRRAAKQQSAFEAKIPQLATEAWQLQAEVLIDDFTSVRFAGEIPLD